MATSPLQGLQQNLLSNSLSITTTTITSTTSTSTPKNSGSTILSMSASKAQTSVSKKQSGDGKDSGRKSLPSSKSSDKYGFLGASLNLPDLPKSLSITPTIPGNTGSSVQKSSSSTVKKLIKEAKAASSMANLGKYNLNPGLSITKESVSSNSKMLSSYQEFLKNYSSAQTMGAVNKKSSPITVTGHGLGLQKSKSVTQVQSSSSGSSTKKLHSSTAKIPYDFGKNIASSFSTLPMASPTLSSSPFSQHTPPLTPSPRGSVVVSPPKTLQQKLAERKQQNQQQKSSSASKKPGK
jgi:hypothetical protein